MIRISDFGFWIFISLFLASIAYPAELPTYSAVRAVFSKHCLACHDAREAQGELVMESLEKLMAGGESGKVIEPGKPEESLLVTLIERKQKPFMPPPKKDKKLADEQIDLIKRWIAAGAKADEAGGEPPAKPVTLPRVAPIGAPRDPVNVLRWSPEKKLVAAGRFGAVELRDLEGATVRKLGPIRGNAHDVVFLNGGAQLAAAGGDAGARGQITIWDAATGKRIRTLEGHSDSVYCLAAGADGKLLASGSYDQMIHLWNLETGAEIRALKGHNGAVYCLSMRPDGKVLASASADRTVKLWDLATGKRLDTLSQPTRDQQAVTFSPDGKLLAAAGADNRIRLWAISHTAREGSNKLLESRFAHEGAILRLSWSHDGRWLASAAEDKSVKIWNAAGGELHSLLPAQPDWPAGLCLAAGDRQIIVGRLDGSIQRYDLATAKPLGAAPALIDEAAIAAANGKKAASKTAAEKKAAKAMTEAAAPRITAIEPRGIQRGKTARVKLTGSKLASPESVTVASGKAAVKIAPKPEAGDTAVWILVAVPADAPIGPVELWLKAAAGISNQFKLHIDDLPQAVEKEPNDSPAAASMMKLPVDQWGLLKDRGDVDRYALEGQAGQIVVFDVAAGRIDSKADLQLTLNDPAGNLVQPRIDVEDDIDPLMSYRLPVGGRYVLTVRDRQLGASAEHFYRLSAGALPVATGIHPLGIPVGKATQVRLIGINLPAESWVQVAADKPGDWVVPVETIGVRSRKPLKALASAMNEQLADGANHTPRTAMRLRTPGAVSGRIMPGAGGVGEADFYRFAAKKGENWVIETTASRRGSPIDTRLAILHPDGRPVQRLLLRAVRDSAITFRPIDATSKGARLVNWEEMTLNEYLYMRGEVVRLFLAPRGPDSEFDFYSIDGKRRAYFDTSSTAHALDDAAYIVQPLPPDAHPSPNGLPTFPLYYTNDDDQLRNLGSDSRIHFTAPADGDYLIGVTDARGFGSDRQAYRLVVRPAEPDFQASLNFGAITARSGSQNVATRAKAAAPQTVVIPAGSGLSFDVNIERLDEFDGPIRIDIAGLPSGFGVSTPLVVEAGHVAATGTIYVPADAPPTQDPIPADVTITATAEIDGKLITRELSGFGSLAVGAKPKLMPVMQADSEGTKIPAGIEMTVITVVPGRLTPAWLTITRNGFEERVSFDVLNLPHGVIVADIGLNGVLIPEKQTERRIFIQCDRWVADQDRIAYARTREDGNRATRPVLIQVRRSPSQVSR